MSRGKISKCQICQQPVEPMYRPFCSKRCQLVDLKRWLNEEYMVISTKDGQEESLEELEEGDHGEEE